MRINEVKYGKLKTPLKVNGNRNRRILRQHKFKIQTLYNFLTL